MELFCVEIQLVSLRHFIICFLPFSVLKFDFSFSFHSGFFHSYRGINIDDKRLKLSLIMSIFAKRSRGGGGVLMPMSLSYLIKFLARSWIDFHYNFKIYNSEKTTWQFLLLNTHSIFVCFFVYPWELYYYFMVNI